jgi:hypothetical protein
VPDWLHLRYAIVPNPLTVGTKEDLNVALRTIEERKPGFNRAEIERISRELTANLLTDGSPIPRVTRRYMNEYIVRTLITLNGHDLSYLWQHDLPEEVDLSYLDLTGLDLKGVRFPKAFMIYTDLRKSNLDDATFDDSWIRNTRFDGASLSETKFVNTDWFNALGIPINAKDGRPTVYDEWMRCPDGYGSGGERPFIQLLETWYDVKFEQLTASDDTVREVGVR